MAVDSKCSRRLALLSALLAALATSAAPGQERGRRGEDRDGGERFEFAALATLGSPVKGSEFHEVSYTVVEEGKRVKKSALVKLDASSRLLNDRVVPIESLEAGAAVRLFGRPEEREVPGNGAVPGGIDYRIKLVQFVAVGGDLRVNRELADKSDGERVWCDGTVEKAGKGGLSINFKGQTYNVSFDKTHQIIGREEVPAEAKEKLWPKVVRRGALLVIRGNASEEKPKVEKKLEDAPVFEAVEVIVVDRRAAASYGQHLAF